MRVIGYLRVSTDEQVGEDKFGLEAQERQIREFCEKKGHDIYGWVRDEARSGADFRPGFDELAFTERYTSNEYKAVVVAKFDRVARDINVYYYYKMALKRKDIDLISVSEDFGEYGAMASAFEALTLVFAEMEKKNIMLRTEHGKETKASHGGWVGGTAPYGYDGVHGKLVVNPEEAEGVRAIFALRFDYGKTYDEIIEYTLSPEHVFLSKNGRPFSKSSILWILRNKKLYQGYYRYNHTDWVKGRHEPIIDKKY
ncbi:MAG: recombinase family protein [Clostridia bacterium]|nr:recombinase family protein [Clostridia bacterium]